MDQPASYSKQVKSRAVDALRQELKDELSGEMPQAMRKQLPGFADKRKTWLRGRARARFDSLPVDEQVSRLQKAFECDVAMPVEFHPCDLNSWACVHLC